MSDTKIVREAGGGWKKDEVQEAEEAKGVKEEKVVQSRSDLGLAHFVA
jgi:hypothetical protein